MIKSRHTFIFNAGGSATANLQIQERSRSVKALFAVLRRNPPNIATDSHATFFSTQESPASVGVEQTLQQYQFRIGGRYFPAAPVQCSINPGSATSNGAAEAYVELSKALNIVGDYRLSSSVNSNRWAMTPQLNAVAGGVDETIFPTNLNEYDFDGTMSHVAGNVPVVARTKQPLNGTSGTLGSSCFAMSTSLETSNGIEISGLNAEEQVIFIGFTLV